MSKQIITSQGLIERKGLWTRLKCPHTYTDGEYSDITCPDLRWKQYVCFRCGKIKVSQNMPISYIGDSL